MAALGPGRILSRPTAAAVGSGPQREVGATSGASSRVGLSLVSALVLAVTLAWPASGQGGSYLSSIGQVLGMASQEISSFKPSKEGGRSSAEPLASGESRYRIDKAWDRDTLTRRTSL